MGGLAGVPFYSRATWEYSGSHLHQLLAQSFPRLLMSAGPKGSNRYGLHETGTGYRDTGVCVGGVGRANRHEKKQKAHLSQERQGTLAAPALRKLRESDSEFKTSLSYI